MNDVAPDDEAQLQEKLLKLQDEKAAREEQRRKAKVKRDLLVLELESKYESDLGPRGQGFEIVAENHPEGPIVVKLAEAVAHKKLTSSKLLMEDVEHYVLPCVVYPERDRYLQIVGSRPEIRNRCANALFTLQGAKTEADAGKF